MQTRVPRTLAALVITIAVTVHGQAPAPAPAPGAIRGHVQVPDEPTPADRPGVSSLSGRGHMHVDRRKVVVYLDAAPRQAFDELKPGRARMDQRGEQFVPRILAITTGTTVDFPNNDTTFHNVFSLSRVRTFDLGRFPPGKSGSVRFDRPGIVPVFCDIHTHMSAYILVFTHPFFAVSDDDGHYEIDGVPPGSYNLKVWSELGVSPSRRVTVSEGNVSEADFQVSREP